ncbi:HlyD family secretion protein [Mobilicoccus massiliensis]|uniref:HlyD family secretion protein n=1 Tax=Mobilicoccus massiliensis TaxID=1522310 RepID=UPI001141A817|nr:efflux RND transporter periplasmic adaptor subunit [Mobilicoccus massiliensis]
MARPPKKVVARIVAIVVVLCLAIGAWYWWRGRQAEETGGALTASGSIEANEYQVAPATAGTVTKVHVAEGDTVKAGQTLVELDARPLSLQVDQANEGVRAARAAVDQAKDDDGSDAEISAARARLAQAEAAVQLAKVQQGYATVKAPHAGTVATLATNAGQNAAPAKTLVTLLDPADLYVRAYVPEPRIGDARLGHTASVTTDSTTRSFGGTVSYVASTAEFTPNTVETEDQRAKLVYEVRLRVADDSGTLKPGMPVTVTFR